MVWTIAFVYDILTNWIISLDWDSGNWLNNKYLFWFKWSKVLSTLSCEFALTYFQYLLKLFNLPSCISQRIHRIVSCTLISPPKRYPFVIYEFTKWVCNQSYRSALAHSSRCASWPHDRWERFLAGKPSFYVQRAASSRLSNSKCINHSSLCRNGKCVRLFTGWLRATVRLQMHPQMTG